ncbi:hypothetical protein F444_02302, partial [Phytophthora nicotianae P1976]
TVLITGSNRGLGFAFAKHYMNAGWSVIATTRKGSDSQHDESTVLQAAKELKGIPIDLLINNADIYTGGDSMASTIKESMMKEFEVHAAGPL